METINYILGHNDLKIVQDTNMFNYSLDSVLLPNFVTINKKVNNILDIGTGNAPIPIILSKRTSANITGVELQKDVFDLALKTVKLNNLENQINLINKNIKDYYKDINSDFYDVITCNPPYFKLNNQSKTNDSLYKVKARHEESLNIEDIMIISKKLLKNNGYLSIVHRPDRLIDIIVLMKKYNIEPKRIQFIYPSKKKEANILLIEGIKNGKPGLKIDNPIYSHDNLGNYTKELLEFVEKR